MRIVTGAISHETSTFTTVETPFECYEERFGFMPRGEQVLERFSNTNVPTGGFIEGAKAHGFELLPTIYANAHPSGRTSRAVFDTIVNELLERMEDSRPFDGVLLELHGSMAAEGIDDAEGHILKRVRELVGPAIPIVGQLDIHSNVSHEMIEMADALIGRETYPEVDMAVRGRECADVIVRTINGEVKPAMALHQIPMMWGVNQVTAHSPMREAIAELHRLESLPGVICGSIATCYPLADVPDLGSSVYVVTNNDSEAAQRHADDLGNWIYARKEDWHKPTKSTVETLRDAQANGAFPCIFADRNDNTGGGSPGDSTGMLQTFVDAGLQDACLLYMVDPEAVAACAKAGVGARLKLDVGGKSTPIQGKPVSLDAEVIALSDGKFLYDGPMLKGLQGNMGPSAHIVQDGIHVLLVSGREQPFCTAFSRTLKLDPKQMKYIGVKSTAHFRAGFESWAGQVHVVDEPNIHSPANVQFVKKGRPLYPLDR